PEDSKINFEAIKQGKIPARARYFSPPQLRCFSPMFCIFASRYILLTSYKTFLCLFIGGKAAIRPVWQKKLASGQALFTSWLQLLTGRYF
ncbi:MAG: hypothetical protein QF526_06390, partial [Alphaproteobacteria bacterium]|nr:hypothetical protein [Alphaproteobacteria bacterium]